MKRLKDRVVLVIALQFPCMVLAGCLWDRGQRFEDIAIRTPLNREEFLVLGFMGGRDSWDDGRQGVRKLALDLRSRDLPGVQVETIENKKRDLAVALVQKAFDTDRNGTLDQIEKQSANIILYGHSFGGAAVVKLARQLHAIQVPILLTVQIDSVGRNDASIPPNVALAANLFQTNGIFIKGEPFIYPQEPARTEILGNFQFDYASRDIDISNVHWFKKLFRVAHTKMGNDPEVWSKVEQLILSMLLRKNPEVE